MSAQSEGWKHTGEGEGADYPVYSPIHLQCMFVTLQNMWYCAVYMHTYGEFHTLPRSCTMYMYMYLVTAKSYLRLLSPWCYWTVYWVIKIFPHLCFCPHSLHWVTFILHLGLCVIYYRQRSCGSLCTHTINTITQSLLHSLYNSENSLMLSLIAKLNQLHYLQASFTNAEQDSCKCGGVSKVVHKALDCANDGGNEEALNTVSLMRSATESSTR